MEEITALIGKKILSDWRVKREMWHVISLSGACFYSLCISLSLSVIVSSSDLPPHTITSLHGFKSHVSLEGHSAGIILPFCECVCVCVYICAYEGSEPS